MTVKPARKRFTEQAASGRRERHLELRHAPTHGQLVQTAQAESTLAHDALAAGAGLSPKSISKVHRWRTGEAAPNLRHLVALAESCPEFLVPLLDGLARLVGHRIERDEGEQADVLALLDRKLAESSDVTRALARGYQGDGVLDADEARAALAELDEDDEVNRSLRARLNAVVGRGR